MCILRTGNISGEVILTVHIVKNRLVQICLPLLTLTVGTLWPVNNVLCRFLIIVSALFLCVSLGIAWYELFKRHKKTAVYTAICFAAVVFSFCIYMSSGKRYTDENTAHELRRIYVDELRSFEGTRYVWGGENLLGIDCSGLPRKALRNALLKTAILNGKGRYLRYAVKCWWVDASASALASGYKHYLTPLEIKGTVADAPENKLSPGDLAITEDGTHVMVFLEKGTWISADPSQGKVVVEKPSVSRNPWFNAKVRFFVWSVLLSYNDNW